MKVVILSLFCLFAINLMVLATPDDRVANDELMPVFEQMDWNLDALAGSGLVDVDEDESETECLCIRLLNDSEPSANPPKSLLRCREHDTDGLQLILIQIANLPPPAE